MSPAPSPAAGQARRATPPLVWLGALRDPSGYADEARAFLLALERVGYEISARDVRWTPMDAGLTPSQLGAVERAVARPPTRDDHVLVHHRVPSGGQRLRIAGPNVWRTMFETDRLPDAWLGPLLAVDRIWVPTEFNVETFERGGIPGDRLRVLPGTLDYELFDPAVTEPDHIEGRRGFCFLAAFDFTDRKGWDLLVDAWSEAFDPDDDVSLVLKCLAFHTTEAEISARLDAHLDGRETAPILLDTRVIPLCDFPRLYAAADGFVLPSRGEGWGRPYMEAMAMTVPTIGSRFGGNLAFMNDGNSWLLDGQLVPVPESAQRHAPYYAGHRWFDPDRDALVEALREVAHGGEETRVRAERARADLLAGFGQETTAETLIALAREALEHWQWARNRPVACVWRGEWGSRHSLAVVNDGVVGDLERRGEVVRRMLPDAAQADLPAVGVAQHWPPRFDPPARGPFVLCQPWEFGAVPRTWVDEIRQGVDEVWVCSESTRKAYLRSGVPDELVHVVPCGVDLDHFAPDGPAWQLDTGAATTFLFVGGTIHRKGIDLLLAAYGQSFTTDDDVLLVIKSFGGRTVYRGMTSENEIAAFAARPGAPRVLLLEEDVAYAEMPSLYRAADVLVQPYRGEGFCLPALEALACGVPVIATAGGPTDEFLTDDCAWRIPSREVPLPRGALPPELELAGEGFLLEPDVTALAAALSEAAQPEPRAQRAAAARLQAEALPWSRAGAIAHERLEKLAKQTPVRLLAPAAVPGCRGTLFAVIADWERSETWAEAVVAYGRAFGSEDDTTLALMADDAEEVGRLVEHELTAAGIDLAGLADIVLVDGVRDPAALELAADAVVCANGHRPRRAARVLPPDPDALRAVAAGAGRVAVGHARSPEV